jgi:hypothetical protein
VIQARESALKRELDRKAKQKCAVLIQKNWKGYQQRKEFLVIRDNLMKIK